MLPMRRLARHLSAIASALSLALCIGVMLLWGRSYDVADTVAYWRRVPSGKSAWMLSTYDGHVVVRRFGFVSGSWGSGKWASDKAGWMFETRPLDWPIWPQAGAREPGGKYEMGFGLLRQPEQRAVAFPFWFACLVLLVLPIRRANRWARGRRWARAGRCSGCGYDLRASPDKCPECGTAGRSAARAESRESPVNG